MLTNSLHPCSEIYFFSSILYSVQSTTFYLTIQRKILESCRHYLSICHLIFIFTLIAFILCLDYCARLLIGHRDSRPALFKHGLCSTPLYPSLPFTEGTNMAGPLPHRKLPRGCIAESKQLVLLSTAFPIQALAISAATVLLSFCVLMPQTASREIWSSLHPCSS